MKYEDPYIGPAVTSAGAKAQYDKEVKKLLSDKTVIAWLLQYCTSEFRGMPIDDIIPCIEGTPQVGEVPVSPRIKGEPQEDAPSGEGTITYDIRSRACVPGDKPIELLLNIEAQKAFDPGYSLPVRGLFYTARMLSAQQNVEFFAENYDDIKKVYSIWVCMDAPSYAIREYKVTPTDLFGSIDKDLRYDILSVVFVCLKRNGKGEKEQLHKMLDVLLSPKIPPAEKIDTLRDEYDYNIPKEGKESNQTMCNVSDLIAEEARAEGAADALRENVKNLLKILPIEKVAEGLDKPLEEIQAIAKSLQQ